MINIVCVIPARYKSTRFPGKPLADICGRPMIWWVYQQCMKVNQFSKVLIATDDDRIVNICKDYSMDVVVTAEEHPNHMSRIWEVSEKVNADYYICVNGDEPLIKSENIERVIPKSLCNDIYFGGLMRKLNDPAEVIDPSNIKVVINKDSECIYMSRMALPYPKGTLIFNYLKWVGVECFNKMALDFFVNTPMGYYENIEDIDHLRFIENKQILHLKEIESESISVDTKVDLERVKKIMEENNGC